jgi:hypothetical protein
MFNLAAVAPDIEITEDDEQNCFVRSLTEPGTNHLKTVIPDYIMGKYASLTIDPFEFFEAMPERMVAVIIQGKPPVLN